ncbi:PE-PGRS family protein [Mycobacterium tuberculosis CPHL_A]|nr:PE-PGRS family protein [Mycobacterium tuberculosis CPHL_A]
MSFVIAAPETLGRAASNFANIGSDVLGAANAAALGPTTELSGSRCWMRCRAAIASLVRRAWPGLSGR